MSQISRLFGHFVRSARGLQFSTQAPSDEVLQRELYLDNQVVRLVFNSAKKRNALSLEFMASLQKELEEIDKIEQIRAVILAGDC